MAIRTYGPNAVDWEQRVDLDRLRTQRLQRLSDHLERSDLGSLLTFDFSNIRYMTSTHIGTWAMDKLIRFALLPRGGEPVIWDFGSAARHHQLYNPWLDGTNRARAGISTLRGAFHPDAGIAQEVARKIATHLRERGLANDPVGVDLVEMPILAALQAEGLDVVDGQQVFLEARRIKTPDEIALLAQACSMVDAAYDELYAFLRPASARTSASDSSPTCSMASAASTSRASMPSPASAARRTHTSTATASSVRATRRSSTSCTATWATGRATTARSPSGAPRPAQRDAYVRCREFMDSAIAMVKPGVTTADIVELWPRAQDFGFPDEEAAFALQYGHGVGLSIWEKPIFSRLVSLDHPEVLEEGMVFALETYWPAGDGWSAARIEEEVVVTAEGCEVITKFPAEELLVAGASTGPSAASSTRCVSRSRTSTPPPAGARRREPLDDSAEPAVDAESLLQMYEQMQVIRGVREAGLRPVHARSGQGHHAPRVRPGGRRRRDECGTA